MLRKVGVVAAAAIMLMSQMSCGDSTGPDSESTAARIKWASRAPAAYSYTVFRGCFCPQEVIGPVTVVVRNGVVESRTYTATGLVVPEKYALNFPTVEGLFAQIDKARTDHVASLNVTYDATLGYPTLINVDVNVQMADDEYVYTAKDLVAR